MAHISRSRKKRSCARRHSRRCSRFSRPRPARRRPRLRRSGRRRQPPPRHRRRRRRWRRCASPAACRPTRPWPAGATCRWPKARFGDAIDGRRSARHRRATLADLVALRCGRRATPTTARATSDYLTVRGFVLDNRFNYRRDGLPINAETSIPLDNKARVDILKGTSGIASGTSAPGGLVDYVVKRPLDCAADQRLRRMATARQRARRARSEPAFRQRRQRLRRARSTPPPSARGLRRRQPRQSQSAGARRRLAAGRRDPARRPKWKPATGHSRARPAFSLLGDRVPEVPTPRTRA